MIKVICISGKARAGKDTSAEFIRDYLETQMDDEGDTYSPTIIHYADLLKFYCKQYFGWDGEKNELGRTLLQYVGTEVVRAKEPNFWVDQVKNFINLFKDSNLDYVIIPDCRFPNEVDDILKDYNAVHLRIERPGYRSGLTYEQMTHPSETALDDHHADWKIINSGTLDDLKEKCIEFINEKL